MLELFSGAWNEAGIQVTELLIAVQDSFRRVSKKKQRLGSNLKSLQSVYRKRFLPVLVNGIGAPISITVGSVEPIDAIRSGTLVLGGRCSSL